MKVAASRGKRCSVHYVVTYTVSKLLGRMAWSNLYVHCHWSCSSRKSLTEPLTSMTLKLSLTLCTQSDILTQITFKTRENLHCLRRWIKCYICDRELNPPNVGQHLTDRVLTNLANWNSLTFPCFPDPLNSLFQISIKWKPDVTNHISSQFGSFLAELQNILLNEHGEWLHPYQSLCHPTNLRYCYWQLCT